LRGVGGLAQQIQLVENGLLEFLYHFYRAQLLAGRPVTLDAAGHGVHQADVAADHRQDAGAQNLDHHLASVLEHGPVYLGDGGRGERRGLETVEQFTDRLAEAGLDDPSGLLVREWRHAVLQFGKLLGDVVRQQIPAGGEDLAELDEDGAQFLQCQANACAAGHTARHPGPGHEQAQEADWPEQMAGEDQLVQPVSHQDPADVGKAKELVKSLHGVRCL